MLRPDPSRGIFWGVLAIICLSPLPLASNRPLPVAVLAFASGLLLLVWAVGQVLGRTKGGSGVTGKLPGPAILFLLVCLWSLFQAAPLSFLADPLWESVKPLGGSAGSISSDPAATVTATMRLLLYGAVFWLVMQTTADSDRARVCLKVLVGAGAAYAVYGIATFLSGDEYILHYRKWTYHGALTSTFVNRNSYATFAGLCLLCAWALFQDRFSHITGLKRPFRQKLALALETVFMNARWSTAALLVIAIALFLTASRAGIASSLMALALLVALTMKPAGSSLRRSVAPLMLFTAFSITAVAVAGTQLIARFEKQGIEIDQYRQVFFATTLDAIRSAPWTGTGHGTYQHVIEAYRGPEVPLVYLWDMAHNTWLETAMELGLPATAALVASLVWLNILAFKGLRRRRRGRLYPALGMAASLLVALHSLVDFSLQIPAVAILYAAILGLSLAQSQPRRRRADRVNPVGGHHSEPLPAR
ncbi:O-antigen ligase family protein [Parvibaculum sp.]|uniref:O-antigen ligase family protein n=1 Tax=Parvibaculum sp. TaxID=2024848 RepID=UPI0026262B73|nr:O-antigen ligase family protein [Parvibaculum sp.]MCW5726920.1 O-antigen ligase family protein [Parvibaculum sp.]